MERSIARITQTLLRELTEKFDTAHMPIEFLNHSASTPQGALDPKAAGAQTALKDLLKVLYAPASTDTLEIVGHFVGPHFAQLAPTLLQEKDYLENQDHKTVAFARALRGESSALTTPDPSQLAPAGELTLNRGAGHASANHPASPAATAGTEGRRLGVSCGPRAAWVRATADLQYDA